MADKAGNISLAPDHRKYDCHVWLDRQQGVTVLSSRMNALDGEEIEG